MIENGIDERQTINGLTADVFVADSYGNGNTFYTKAQPPTFSVKIATALAQAQAAMPALLKDSENPHLKSRYASLAAVLDVVQGPLRDAGLLIYQPPRTERDGSAWLVVVRSYLIHIESGEYIMDELAIPIDKADAQGVGRAITYGRRYLLISQCSLAPEDDDGESISNGSQQNGKPAQPAALPAKASQAQIKEFQALCKKAYVDDAAKKEGELVNVISNGKVKKAADLSTTQISRLIDGLQTRVAEQAKEAAANDEDGRPEWKSPADAHAWAADNGFADDKGHAQKLWRAMITEHFAGKIGADNLEDAFNLFFDLMVQDAE
jgi:hypothetical protein